MNIMDTQNNAKVQDTFLSGDINSATRMTLLDLNNIRLDVKHTILTPAYLESLVQPVITSESMSQNKGND